MAESNPRFSAAQRQALRAQPLTAEQLAESTGATILPADRTVTEGTAFTAASTKVFTSGFLVDDIAPGTAAEESITPARVTPSRVMRTTAGNDAGTPVTYGAGAVAATTPRMTLASDDPAVVSLQLIDDWYEVARAKVNPIVGQAGVQGGSGVVTAATQRTVLATDVPLPAGTNYIGRTRDTDGTNDETALFDLDSGAGTQYVHGISLRRSGAGGSAEMVGQGTMAQSVPVVIASDQTRVPVDIIAGQTGVQGGSGVVTAATQRVAHATDVRVATDPISGQVGVQGGSGVVTASTQRMTLAADMALADGAANPTSPMIGGAQLLYNGTTWDRDRSNIELTLLLSAARTVATNSADQLNYNGRGIHVIVDMTVFGGSGSITPVIAGKDPVSGKYYEILRGVAIVANGLTILKVYPGIATAANAAASDIIPRTWRIQIEVASATSHTYSVGAVLVR